MNQTKMSAVKGKMVHLILTGHWFDETVSGRKTIEYRDNTRYWRRRLIKGNPCFAVFHRGYTRVTATYEIAMKVLKSDGIKLYLGRRIDV